jgi:prevent-host-death family protein
MKKRVTAMQARQKFGEMLDGVYHKGDEVVIERNGKVMGVVIPGDKYDLFKRLRQEARKWALDFMTKIQHENKDADAELIEREIAEVIREVRQEKYGKPKAKKASAA